MPPQKPSETTTVPADRYGPKTPGGGRMAYVAALVEARGTTPQACGLWPFGVPSGAPLVGTPMGVHQRHGGAICFDPISWFQARLLPNPNVFIAGQPGLGKSTMVRRMVLGYTACGITPLILGDLKPDYTHLVEALGGQVIRIGPGRDTLNPLDAGPWRQALPRLDERTATLVQAGVISRRRAMVEALATLVRRAPLMDGESAVLTAAIRYLSEAETHTQPVLRDIVDVITAGPPSVRAATLDRGEDARYRAATDALLVTLLAIVDGPLGHTFDGPTTTAIDLDTTAVVVDISGIDAADDQLTAAALLSAWAYGFAQVQASHLLADLGLGPKRTFIAVMDEMWRALRAPGMVDKFDALTRLSRQEGTGLAYVVHSLDDLDALGSEVDRAKARGLAERCAAKVLFGLSREQLTRFSHVVELSDAEMSEVIGWSQRDGWTARAHATDTAPGRGKCLLKVGNRPGLPVYLQPTDAEKTLGDTDARFSMGGRR